MPISFSDNPEARTALRILNDTHTSLFLTGKAGTGKTTFLKSLHDMLSKRMIVLASTGIAAINAGGATLHSFFQLPFSPFVPGSRLPSNVFRMAEHKKKLIRSLDLIVIDEVSMVRADVMDAIDEVLRTICRRQSPFGGIQLLLIGDLGQLAPVVRPEEWDVVRDYYATPYFFSSKALAATRYVTIELQNVYRQTDSRFLSLLNALREGRGDENVLSLLNTRYQPGMSLADPAIKGVPRLVTHNRQADDINQAMLDALTDSQPYTYEAQLSGTFPAMYYPTDPHLVLKKGAQVMFVKNNSEKRFYNGLLGEVVDISSDGFTVRPRNGEELIEVEPERWDKVCYKLNKDTQEVEESVEGSFIQFPVRTAWAITIHKSQGLTFERVIIDASAAFAAGQTYVALSRCRSLQGIILTQPLTPSAVITDPSVRAFASSLRVQLPSEVDIASMQRAYTGDLMAELFTFEEERVTLAQMLRLAETKLYSLQPHLVGAIRRELADFDKHVMIVAGTFRRQYIHLWAAGSPTISDDRLLERLQAAATYFDARLATLAAAIASATTIVTDQKDVQRRYRQLHQILTSLLQDHMTLLRYAADHPFDVHTYQETRLRLTMQAGKVSAPRGGKKGKKSTSQPESVNEDIPHLMLFDKLQAWRTLQAKSDGLPPYMVAHNKALISLCRTLPTDEAELLATPHIGLRFVERYGEQVLAVLTAYLQSLSS